MIGRGRARGINLLSLKSIFLFENESKSYGFAGVIHICFYDARSIG